MRRMAVFLPWLLLAACSVQQQEIRVPALVLPAAGVTRLSMDVNLGNITITPSTDGQVHVTLSLKPSTSFFGLLTDSSSLAAARQAAIGHALSNGTLTLGVQFPANTEAGGIGEQWNVALPPPTAVTGHVNVGELNVSGIAGGVQADLSVGKVQLDVPGGPLKVTADVGKIQATVRSLDYSDVALGSSVGKVSLTVDGVNAGNLQKTGAGENLNYKMNGKSSINLQVTTGSVRLALRTH
jgi:hypothetical protein